MPIPRRCSSSACRARARRSPSRFSAAHPQAHGAGERSALGRLAWRLGGGESPSDRRIAALDRATLDAEAEAYLRELHALAPDKTRIVDKMPGNYLYVWLIALLFPKAKIIHCVRDPRDIGFSIFTFRFHGEHGYAHDLADLGWMIGEQDRLMKHWKARFPADPDLAARRLGERFRRDAGARARPCRSAARPGLRALL